MLQRSASVLGLLLLAAALRPCGPWYDDAHHGQREALHDVDLAQFCYALFHGEGTIASRVAAGEAEVAAAVAAEAAGDWTAAVPRWEAAFTALHGYGDMAQTARCADRLGALASGASAEDLRCYCSAVDGGDTAALDRLLAGHGALADDAALALARSDLAIGDRAGVAATLARFDADWPGSEQAEAAAFLAAHLVLETWRSGGKGADPEPARCAFAGYLARFPAGRHRADALGWLAHLRWMADRDDPEALAIYLRLFLDPDLHGLFLPTVDSLHLVFARCGSQPPPAVLADPRSAAAYLFNRSRSLDWGDTAAPGLGREALAAAARKASGVLPDLARTTLPASVLSGLATACFTAGAPDAASGLANAVLQRGPDATALYLQARILAEAGKAEEADFCFARLLLLEPADPRLADLGMRVGAAYEQQGDAVAALRTYLRVDALTDALIVADGEIAVDDLARFLAGRQELVAEAHGGEAQDRLTWLRDIAAARLARVGRLAEAMPLAGPPRRAAIARLMACEAAVAAGGTDPAAARYALAAFWYREGRAVVHVSCQWHQCFEDSLQRALDGTGDERDRAREANLLAMTTYQRARPLFLAIAADFPDSPEAPKALYSAALCDYWLCGNTYLGTSDYWQRRAQRDGLWRRGDGTMAELRGRYPAHPLATGDWAAEVRKRVGD
jgi:tetratricopeptide (TPR) repeat protein